MAIDPEVVRTTRAHWVERERQRFQRREELRRRVLAEVRAAVPPLARVHREIRSIALFGSLLAPGRFTERSDIDLALDCDDLEAEGRFRRALQEQLGRPVDTRPRRGAIARAVELSGERIYEREEWQAAGPRAQHPG